MSATGGFWPGEAPAAQEEDVQEPEAAVAEQAGWPEPHQEASEPEPEPEPERETEQTSVADPAVTEPEPAAEEETEEEAEPEVIPVGHVPGELDIPDGV